METKLYDLTSLEAAVDGDQAFMNKMIQLILTETPEELKAMESALGLSDYQRVSSIAHKLKSSIHFVCISSLFSSIREVEEWKQPDEIMIKKTQLLIANISALLDQIENI